MTPIRSLLAAAVLALASAIALPTHALILPDATAAKAPSAHALNGKDTPAVKIKNTAARIVHLNLGAQGLLAINPLAEVTLSGDQARCAKEALDTSLKALVDDGTLVVDGSAKAPPPNPEPPADGTTNMGDQRLAPSTSDLSHGDTDPAGYSTPSGTPDTPSSSSSSGKRAK